MSVSRRDKILRMGRYLRAASGIPSISATGTSIEAPAPYTVAVYTGKDYQRWGQACSQLQGREVLVWPQGHVEVQDTLVTMRAQTYAELLGAHWDAGLARRRGGE